MTEKRIAIIYRSTCVAQGRIVDPAMGARWRAVLGRFTREEVPGGHRCVAGRCRGAPGHAAAQA
jgi:hypothetical protein